MDETPANDPVPEQELPPERIAGGLITPSPFADLPKPSRRGDPVVAVPFDPLGYQVLASLAEVQQKPVAPDGVLTKAQIDASRRKATFVPKFSTLEAMYAQHPELLKWGRLRIERVQPQWYDDAYGQKTRVSGTLSFRNPCISSEEFARLFGGFRYRVFGAVDQENRENEGGPPQPVEIAVAEFEVPLPPNLDNLPVAVIDPQMDVPAPLGFMGDVMFGSSPYGRRTMMPGMMGYPMQMPASPNQSIGVEPVLNFASQVMQQRQQPQSPPVSDAVWNVLGKQNEFAQQNMRELTEQNMRILQANNEQLQRQIEAERQRVIDVSNRPTDMVQMVESVSKLTAAQKGGMDSDTMRQLRDDHERQLRFMKEENDRAVARQREEFERAMKMQRDDLERLSARERETSELKMRIGDERIKDLEKRMEQRERQLLDDMERRERQLKDEHTRVIDSRDREYLARMSEMKEMHARELSSIKDMHDREMRMRETVQSNTSQVTDKAHQIEMRSLQTDLAKLSGELEEKRRLVEEHMADKNKPLLEQVKEVQELSRAVQEMAGGSDDEKGDGEEKWYNSPIFRDLAKVALVKGSELLPKLAEAAKAAGSKQAQGMGLPPGQPAMMPRRMMSAPVPTGLPARRRKKVMFADADGAPLRDTREMMARQVEGDMGLKSSAPRQFIPDAPEPLMTAERVPMPPPTAVAAQPQPVPRRPRAAAAEQPQAERTPDAGPTQGQPSELRSEGQDPWEPLKWMPMSAADSINFLTQLNSAFENKVVPTALVEAFCSHFPMEVVAQLPVAIPVSKLIEGIRVASATKDWAIASGGGRRYLADVWTELSRRVKLWHEQQAAGGQEQLDDAQDKQEAQE